MERRCGKRILRSRRKNFRIPVTGITVRHATFAGRLVDRSMNGLAIESEKGLRIGGSYQLELVGDTKAVVLDVVVRWCRLLSVAPGQAVGDFAPLFRTGFELDSSLSGAVTMELRSMTPPSLQNLGSVTAPQTRPVMPRRRLSPP